MSAAALLAADISPSAGPFGLLLVLLIGVTTILLIRNMDKRVKRLPREFPPDAGPDGPPRGGAGPDAAP